MGPHLAHVHENPAGTIGVPSHRAFERCRILTNSTSVHTADLGENLLVSSSLPSLAPMSTWKGKLFPLAKCYITCFTCCI